MKYGPHMGLALGDTDAAVVSKKFSLVGTYIHAQIQGQVNK